MMRLPVPVVLASSSATRRELLAGLVADFTWTAPAVAEDLLPGEDPEAGAVRLASGKARQVAAQRPGCLVIGADTLVVCGGEVMGKPTDRAGAVRMLARLTSSEHRVVTGLAVIAPDGRERTACVAAGVRMKPMSAEALRRHCEQPEVLGWAGAYALQPEDPNVESLSGSATAVMGLPMEELERLLRGLYPRGEDRLGAQ
jgi:septum formation protein